LRRASTTNHTGEVLSPQGHETASATALRIDAQKSAKKLSMACIFFKYIMFVPAKNRFAIEHAIFLVRCLHDAVMQI
jgi:hypothetical protein